MCIDAWMGSENKNLHLARMLLLTFAKQKLGNNIMHTNINQSWINISNSYQKFSVYQIKSATLENYFESIWLDRLRNKVTKLTSLLLINKQVKFEVKYFSAFQFSICFVDFKCPKGNDTVICYLRTFCWFVQMEKCQMLVQYLWMCICFPFPGH